MAAVSKPVVFASLTSVEPRLKSFYLREDRRDRWDGDAAHAKLPYSNEEMSARLSFSESLDNVPAKLIERYPSQSSLDSIERDFMKRGETQCSTNWINELNSNLDAIENEDAMALRLKDELIGIERKYEEFERCVQRLPGFKDSRNRIDQNAPLIYGSTPPEQGVFVYGDPIGVGIKVPHLEKFQDTSAYADKIPQASTNSSSAVTPRASATTAPKAIQSRPATSTTAGATGTTDKASTHETAASARSRNTEHNEGGQRKISSSSTKQQSNTRTSTTNSSRGGGGNYDPYAPSSSRAHAAEARYYQQASNDEYYQQGAGNQRYYTNSKYQQYGNSGRGGGSGTIVASSKQQTAQPTDANRNWRNQTSPQQQQQSENASRKAGVNH